jgi:hypothetical protein
LRSVSVCAPGASGTRNSGVVPIVRPPSLTTLYGVVSSERYPGASATGALVALAPAWSAALLAAAAVELEARCALAFEFALEPDLTVDVLVAMDERRPDAASLAVVSASRSRSDAMFEGAASRTSGAARRGASLAAVTLGAFASRAGA